MLKITYRQVSNTLDRVFFFVCFLFYINMTRGTFQIKLKQEKLDNMILPILFTVNKN